MWLSSERMGAGCKACCNRKNQYGKLIHQEKRKSNGWRSSRTVVPDRPSLLALKAEVQTPLHLPHIRRGVSDLSRTGNIYGGIGQSQVCVIEGIEILPAEFQRLAFRNHEIFRQRQIKQILRRPTERALRSGTVAERLLWRSESSGIEPQVTVGVLDMRIANHVGPHVVEVRV